MQTTITLKEIVSVLDASELSSSSSKTKVERHDVAECILQTQKPIAFDKNSDAEATGRFVIVDDYEIAGGGIIVDSITEEQSLLEQAIAERNATWQRGSISQEMRENALNQKAKVILITAEQHIDRISIAKELETALFNAGQAVYFLGFDTIKANLLSHLNPSLDHRAELIRRIGELAHTFADAGLQFITTLPDLDDFEAQLIEDLVAPTALHIVNIGAALLQERPANQLLDETESTQQLSQAILQALQGPQGGREPIR